MTVLQKTPEISLELIFIHLRNIAYICLYSVIERNCILIDALVLHLIYAVPTITEQKTRIGKQTLDNSIHSSQGIYLAPN